MKQHEQSQSRYFFC